LTSTDLYTSFQFPKSVRLLTSGDYSDVFQDVDVRVSSKHFLILARGKNLPTARLGIIVAKKNVKLAVHRNRVKRLLRESFRLRQATLPNLDLVVLAKKGIDRIDNPDCASELQFLWNKLSRKVESA
jgi:ribonuclease P protein component